ncbi:MAG: ATPase, T2SS/T4P/T4SS family, partial [Planctomycetota bacterium]
MSTRQAAELLGTSEQAVMGWIRNGWLPFRKLSDGVIRISQTGLIHFLRDRGLDVKAIVDKVAAEEAQQFRPVEAAAESEAQRVAEAGVRAEPEEPEFSAARAPSSEAGKGDQAAPAAQVAEAILQDAVVKRASAIHLDPCPDGLTLRIRIDGVLHTKANFKQRLPKKLAPQLIAHFKELAGLEVDDTARPQKGHFHSTLDGGEREFCVAALPGLPGERLTVHLVEPPPVPLGLSELALAKEDLELLGGVLREPFGMVVVAGQSRIGRTATLRAMVAELDTAARALVAVVRRSDVRLAGVTQCLVDDDGCFTMTEALRAAGDQDADVIVAGDVDDPAAVAAALELALDGRMVLASIPARAGASAIEMMLGSCPRWPLASALSAVVSQRTARVICADCRQEAQPQPDLLARLGIAREEIDFPVYRGTGCEKC